MSEKQASIKVGLDLDKSKLSAFGPEVKSALSALQETFTAVPKNRKPNLPAVVDYLSGTGDKREAQKAVSEARVKIKDVWDQIHKANEEAYAAARREFERRKKAVVATPEFKFDKDASKKKIDAMWRDVMATERAGKDAFTALREEDTRAINRVAHEVRYGDDIPHEDEPHGGGRSGGPGGGSGGGGSRGRGILSRVLGGAKSFGSGMVRAGGGGLLFGGIGLGYLGYRMGRGMLSSASEEVDLYNLARRSGTLEDLTSKSALENQFRGEKSGRGIMAPYLDQDQNFRAYGSFLTSAGSSRGTKETQELYQSSVRYGVGLGIGGEAGAKTFGDLMRMGVGRGGDEKRNLDYLALKLSDAIAEGRMRGREGEVLQSLHDFTQTAMRFSSATPDAASILKLHSGFAAANQGNAAAQGAMGSAILTTAHSKMSGTELFPGMPDLMGVFGLSTLMGRGMGMTQAQDKMSEGLLGRVDGQSLASLISKQFPAGQDNPMMLSYAKSFGFGTNIKAARMFRSYMETGDADTALDKIQKTDPAMFDRLKVSVAEKPERIAGLSEILPRISRSGSPEETAEIMKELDGFLKSNPTVEEHQRNTAEASQNLSKAFMNLNDFVISFYKTAVLATSALEKLTHGIGDLLTFLSKIPGLGHLKPADKQVEVPVTPEPKGPVNIFGEPLPEGAPGLKRHSLPPGMTGWIKDKADKVAEKVAPYFNNTLTAPPVSFPRDVQRWSKEIEKHSGGDRDFEHFVKTLIATESGGVHIDPKTGKPLSGKQNRNGSFDRGVMQLNDSVFPGAGDMSGEDNIAKGAAHAKTPWDKAMSRTKTLSGRRGAGPAILAAAAYNMGEGGLEKWLDGLKNGADPNESINDTTREHVSRFAKTGGYTNSKIEIEGVATIFVDVGGKMSRVDVPLREKGNVPAPQSAPTRPSRSMGQGPDRYDPSRNEFLQVPAQ